MTAHCGGGHRHSSPGRPHGSAPLEAAIEHARNVDGRDTRARAAGRTCPPPLFAPCEYEERANAPQWSSSDATKPVDTVPYGRTVQAPRIAHAADAARLPSHALGLVALQSAPARAAGILVQPEIRIATALAPWALATTIDIPSDQPTIQAGLDAAAEHDTVLVAPGTYTGVGNRDLDFGGIDRVLLSEAGPEATVIDCESEGRGFYFHGGESAASVVRGFTITHGWAAYTESGGGIRCTHYSSPGFVNCVILDNLADWEGGGLYCILSSPTLSDCTISGNRAKTQSGGGIYGKASSLTLTNCTISENSAEEEGGGIYAFQGSLSLTNCTLLGSSANEGGGVYCEQNSPTVTDCSISENAAQTGGGIYSIDGSATFTACAILGNSAAIGEEGGGGIYSMRSTVVLTDCAISSNSTQGYGGGLLSTDSSLILTGCTIAGNFGAHGGGGLRCGNGSAVLEKCTISGNSVRAIGGGIYCYDAIIMLTNCTISDNSSSSYDGGGLSCSWSKMTLRSCTISDNTAGRWGGGLKVQYNLGLPVKLTNCLIIGNSADSGGGLACSDSSTIDLINCTIADNSAHHDGGGIDGWDCFCYLRSSILWGNSPSQARFGGGLGWIGASYSDIQDGWPGEGNIDADPLFLDPANGDYHLRAGSPCIDTATAAGAPDTDFEGDPRPWGAGYDIGADEYTGVGVERSDPPHFSATTMLAPAYPNPFNPYTTIPFELAEPGRVRLAIYDIRGALVQVLVNGLRRAGAHAVRWKGTNSAGIASPTGVYLVRLDAGGLSTTRKVVLVK